MLVLLLSAAAAWCCLLLLLRRPAARELVREVDYTLKTLAKNLLGQERSEVPSAGTGGGCVPLRGGACCGRVPHTTHFSGQRCPAQVGGVRVVCVVCGFWLASSIRCVCLSCALFGVPLSCCPRQGRQAWGRRQGIHPCMIHELCGVRGGLWVVC